MVWLWITVNETIKTERHEILENNYTDSIFYSYMYVCIYMYTISNKNMQQLQK